MLCRDRFARFLAKAMSANQNALERFLHLEQRVLFNRQSAERHVVVELVRGAVGDVQAVRFQRFFRFGELFAPLSGCGKHASEIRQFVSFVEAPARR